MKAVARIVVWAACVVAAALGVVGASPAYGHAGSDSFLTWVDGQAGAAASLQVDVALRDLELAVGLDANGDGNVTWGELRTRAPAVHNYVAAHLRVVGGAGDGCPLTRPELLVEARSDGQYAVTRYQVACPAGAAATTLAWNGLFDINAEHRGLLHIVRGEQSRVAVLAPDAPAASLLADAARGSLRSSGAAGMFRLGMTHIWTGYDHLAFLLLMMLPVALGLGSTGAAGERRSLGLQLLAIVSAFTVAHCITLGLAAAGWVVLPPGPVEIAIAVSVLLAAVYVLLPRLHRRGWMIAFGFGLVHGFGFANVLGDLGLQGAAFSLALLFFNLGVEVGQLAVVAVVLPVIVLGARLRRWHGPLAGKIKTPAAE